MTDVNDLPDMSAQFNACQPFPNAVIESMFDNAALRMAALEFPHINDKRWLHYSNDKEEKRAIRDTKDFRTCHGLIQMMGSRPFISFLTKLTGIQNLESSSLGGGLHMIARDGFLKVHADFNFNEDLQQYRRLNVLLFLNDGWHPGWGGQLELLDEKGTVYRKIDPTINRLVVFATSEKSFHGHPAPLRTPMGVYRKSLAMYYFTKERPDDFTVPHSTLWLEDLKK